jgi:endonuclease/exonuclease/phosphatase family metal-dependent hydrolase
MFNVMSWNVRYFSNGTVGITSTESQLRRVARSLIAMEEPPHVIALQEIDNHSIRSHLGRVGQLNGGHHEQIERFVRYLNEYSLEGGGPAFRHLFFRAHGHGGGRLPLYSTGLAVLHRTDFEVLAHNADDPLDITHRRVRQLSKVKQKRICAHVRFRAPTGEVFDLFNTHLSLPAFLARHNGNTGKRFGEAHNQIAEIERVLEYVGQVGDIEHAVLVGDFNARPGSRVYRHVLENSPLVDVFASTQGLSEAEVDALPSAGCFGLRFRLDHMFAGPGVQFLSFPLAAPYGRTHPMRGLSDHAPIMGHFALR